MTFRSECLHKQKTKARENPWKQLLRQFNENCIAHCVSPCSSWEILREWLIPLYSLKCSTSEPSLLLSSGENCRSQLEPTLKLSLLSIISDFMVMMFFIEIIDSRLEPSLGGARKSWSRVWSFDSLPLSPEPGTRRVLHGICVIYQHKVKWKSS